MGIAYVVICIQIIHIYWILNNCTSKELLKTLLQYQTIKVDM